MWQFRLTDQQFINRLKAGRRWRRTMGMVWTLFGLALLIFFAYMGWRFYSMLNEPPPGIPDAAPSLGTRRMNFSLGFLLGLFLAGGIYGAIALIFNGLVWLLTRDRKTELLLQCWRERPNG